MIPILNVVVDKTLEQALLEVEEEEEAEKLLRYKQEGARRRAQEREDWEQEVRKEVARIK